MLNSDPNSTILHSTAIDISGIGAAIIGKSGLGKSSLAIKLINMGATLVSDDQTLFKNVNGDILISKPYSVPCAIEARGIGLIPVPLIETSKLYYFVKLTDRSLDRLPQVQSRVCLGISVRLIHFNPFSGNDAALFLMLRYGKIKT